MKLRGGLVTAFYLTILAQISYSSLVDQVYIQLSPERTVCFRILNGTHQFGCQSSSNGDVGVIVRVKSVSELKGLQKDCWMQRFPDFSRRQFAIVIDKNILDRDTILLLRNSDCVFSILLVDTKLKDDFSQVNISRSDDQTCPNQHSSLYKDCHGWNTKGSLLSEGLMFTDWQKPVIFITNQTNLDKIEKCHSEFNVPSPGKSDSVHFPLCAVSVKTFSYAAGSSELCLRRSRGATIELDNPVSFCDALQDYNVFAVIPPKAANKHWNENEKRSSKYLMVAARMDSFSFVPEMSPGELSSITSLISSWAAAKAIAQHRAAFEQSAAENDRRLLFSFFHGEAFDYIGSSRAAYDINANKFPMTYDESKIAQKELISMDQIEAYVELQQVGSPDSAGIYAHVHGPSYERKKTATDALISSAKKGLSSISISPSHIIPPSSLHSLIRANGSMAGIVITPFDTQYSYSRINSMHDSNSYSSSERAAVEKAIEKSARAIIEIAKDYCHVQEKITVDTKFISTLFDCLIKSSDWWECPFLASLMDNYKSMKPHKMEKTTYIGADNLSIIRYLTATILTYSTGSKTETQNVHEKEQCDDMNKQQTLFAYVWQLDPFTNTSHCLRTTVFYGRAVSPAFLNKETDLKTTPYSTWTEASYSISWDNKKYSTSGPRLFLLDGSSNENWVFAFGCAFAVISMLVIGRLKEAIFVFDEGEPLAEQGEPL